MVFGKDIPGRTRFITHAVREICNRLPDVISGEKAGPALQYKNRLDEICVVWNKLMDISLPGGESVDKMVGVKMPLKVFEPLTKLIEDHQKARQKPIETADRLFDSLSPDDQNYKEMRVPVIKQWVSVGKWAVQNAHNWKARDVDLDKEEFQQQFEAFEDALCALIRAFYSTIEGLDEILEDTNS